MKGYDVVVAGAGAAGLLAAGRAAMGGARVLLLEKNPQAGRKILITGKGRCNITNTSSKQEYFKNIFPNPRFLKHAFGCFFVEDIIKLLNQQGLSTVEERGNRVFPQSNQAKDVRDTLLGWALKSGAEILYQHNVKKIITENKKVTGVEVSTSEGKNIFIECSSFILSTGGRSYPATGSDGSGYDLSRSAGHNIEAIRPALVPVETAGSMAEQLQGLSLRNVKVGLWIEGKKQQEEFGEMLFTHFGLSGPVILTLSRHIVDALSSKSKAEISIDLKPALDDNVLDQRLLRDLNSSGKKHIENVFKLWLPSKMIKVFLDTLKIDPQKQANQVNAAERRSIRLMMKDLRFIISGHRSFKEAVITAGGVDTNEINSKTMESRIISNLFFAGEVINLDANTGGYNLQIAWSTGWLAGQEAAARI